MDIYTAEEKDNALKAISSERRASIDNKRYMSIIDEYLYPEGLVEKPMKLICPEHYICEISQKGIDFLQAGGFSKLKEEEDEMNEARLIIEKLTAENLRLQNDDFEYKKKIRHQEDTIRIHKYIEAVSWAITTIVGLILIFAKN
ncbi:hypothetical protein [Bacteroides neonati]|uniref:hypothetical protein n=1 Tax=Bacteroides neonati TaxID=1347393 RepID=UPI0004B0F735|nr:hypothetical protein [Bacteroides neonati]